MRASRLGNRHATYKLQLIATFSNIRPRKPSTIRYLRLRRWKEVSSQPWCAALVIEPTSRMERTGSIGTRLAFEV